MTRGPDATEREALTAHTEPGFWRGVALAVLVILFAGLALAYCFGDPM